MQTSIVGIGVGNISYVEYYSYKVMTAFEQYADQIKSAYEEVQAAVARGSTPSPSDYDQLVSALKGMTQLAQNGETDSNGVESYQSYMTADMVKVLSAVTQTLAIPSVAITSSSSLSLSDDEKSAALTNWIQYSSNNNLNLSQNVQNAANFVSNMKSYVVQIKDGGSGELINLNVKGSPTRSLQSMLSLEYVAEGNSVMASHMNDLEQSLSLSKSALNSLQILQNVANQITASTPSTAFQFPPGNNQYFDASPGGYGTKILMNNKTIGTDVLTSIINSTGTKLASAFRTNVFPYLSAAAQTQLLNSLGLSTIDGLITDNQLNNKINVNDYYQYSSVLAAGLADYQTLKGPLGALINKTFANNNIAAFSAAYQIMASAYFSQIFPTANPLQTSATLLLQARAQIQAQINKFIQIMPNESSAQQNLAASLSDSLKQVLGNLNQAFSGVDTNNSAALLNATKKWILDNQSALNSSGVPGSIGQNAANLQSAITNAETLEEQQKEDIQSYLYVFQEFYNSAGAMIEAITKMLSKMASGLGNTKFS